MHVAVRIVMVVGFGGRSERQPSMTVRAMVMMLMRPQTVSVFERAVHRARLHDPARSCERKTAGLAYCILWSVASP
jgi:hypothetical protein